jgi:hypothetical protein
MPKFKVGDLITHKSNTISHERYRIRRVDEVGESEYSCPTLVGTQPGMEISYIDSCYVRYVSFKDYYAKLL